MSYHRRNAALRALAIVLAGWLLLVLMACGGSTRSSDNPTTTGTTPTAGGGTPAPGGATPTPGGGGTPGGGTGGGGGGSSQAEYVYASVSDPGESIYGFSVNLQNGSLTPAPGSPFRVGPGGSRSLSRTGNGLFLYTVSGIVRGGSGEVVSLVGYRVDMGSGTLTEVTRVRHPFARTLSADTGNQWLIVATSLDATAYAIGPDGTLQRGPTTTMPSDTNGLSDIEFHPAGNFIYVYRHNTANNNFIEVYRLDRSSGALTRTFSTATQALFTQLSPDPRGEFLYTAGPGNRGNAVYRFNPNGTLTEVGTFGSDLGGPVAASGADDFVFALGPDPPTLQRPIAVYRLDRATGSLTEVPGSPFPSGGRVGVGWVERSGQFLYMGYVEEDQGPFGVAGFRIDRQTGALSPVPGSPFATEREPMDKVLSVP